MSLETAIQDYQDYGQDVANSSYSAFGNNLRRFVALFESTEPLGQLASQLLPPIDFDAWFNACLASGGSMVGSSTLDWPIPRREKVAHELELLRRIASDQIIFHDFFSRFCWVANNFDLNTSKFIREIFQPFYRDFLRTLQTAMPKNATVPATDPAQSVPNLIDEERLDQLRALRSTRFDYTRLVQLCNELNNRCEAAAARCWPGSRAACLIASITASRPVQFASRSFELLASNGRRPSCQNGRGLESGRSARFLSSGSANE